MNPRNEVTPRFEKRLERSANAFYGKLSHIYENNHPSKAREQVQKKMPRIVYGKRQQFLSQLN